MHSSWLSGNAAAFSAFDGSTTLRLPDSRGEFLRGWDNGRGLVSGRQIYTVQDSGIAAHSHQFGAFQNVVNNLGTGSSPVMTSPTPVPGGSGAANATSVQPGGLSETRPHNIPKLVCIKAY